MTATAIVCLINVQHNILFTRMRFSAGGDLSTHNLRCSDCYRAERTSSRAGLNPLWTSAFHGARKYLNNLVEQDHRTGEDPTWLAKG